MLDKKKITSCPFLGLPNDRGSHYAEPSDAHRCYSPHSPGEIDLDYQQAWCFSSKYPTCQRFVESGQAAATAPVLPVQQQVVPSAAPSVEKLPTPERLARPRRGHALGAAVEIGLWGLAVVLALLAVYSAWSVFFAQRRTSAVADSVALATPSATPRPTWTPSLEPTDTAAATPTGTHLISQVPLVIPTPPNDGTVLTLSPNPLRTGWVATNELAPHWGDSNLHVGSFQNQRYAGVLTFELSGLPPGSKILFAALEITGRNAAHLGKSGGWHVELIAADPSRDWSQVSAEDVTSAQTLAVIGRPLTASELAVGNINRFEFDAAQRGILEDQLTLGRITLRLTAPDVSGDNLFTWDAGSSVGSAVSAPTLYLVAVPAAFTVITNTPTPANVLTAAAYVVRSTDLARRYGTPTPLPPGFITATPGLGSILIAPPPTVGNAATAQAMSAYATAVAITTGTFTPTPKNVVIVYPTATPVLVSADQLAPAPTATSAVALDYLATPIPGFLNGKILAISNRFGGGTTVLPIVMNPDGSVVGALSTGDYYQAAYARESYSPDRRRRAIVAPDDKGVLQIWIQDLNANLSTQITRISRGVAYDPAWSPNGNFIVYVSIETGGDELFLYDLGTETSRRLTDSTGLGLPFNKRPTWSPDSQKIAFWSSRSGHAQIWVVDSDGNNLMNLSNSSADEQNPVWVKP